MKVITHVTLYPATAGEPSVDVRLFKNPDLSPDLRIGGLIDDADVVICFDNTGRDPFEAMIDLGQRIIDAAVKARASLVVDDGVDPFMPAKVSAVAQDEREAIIADQVALAGMGLPASIVGGDVTADCAPPFSRAATLDEWDSRR